MKYKKVAISKTNEILQRYRNSKLTYNLIRQIISEMNDSTIYPIKMDTDVRIIYDENNQDLRK